MTTVGETVGSLAGRFELTGKPLERLVERRCWTWRGSPAPTWRPRPTPCPRPSPGSGSTPPRAGGFLDTLLVASQKSGVGIETLAGIAAAAAPTFTTYGLGAKDSVGLIAALSEAGIPATQGGQRTQCGVQEADRRQA